MINQILFYRIKIITNMDAYLVNCLNEVRDSFECPPSPSRSREPRDELQRRKMSVKEHPFFIAIDKNDTDEVKRLIAANNGKVTSDREDRYDKCGALMLMLLTRGIWCGGTTSFDVHHCWSPTPRQVPRNGSGPPRCWIGRKRTWQ